MLARDPIVRPEHIGRSQDDNRESVAVMHKEQLLLCFFLASHIRKMVGRHSWIRIGDIEFTISQDKRSGHKNEFFEIDTFVLDVANKIDRAVVDIGFTAGFIGRIGHHRSTMDQDIHFFGPFDFFRFIKVAVDQMDIHSIQEMQVGGLPDQTIDVMVFSQKIPAKVRPDETVCTRYQNTSHILSIQKKCHAS
jgi:hypothetical protein